MAILQISRIQVRRGLQQDLPQLASGEFGWSIDKRKLYIGNGTLNEGAPTVGVTEILTQYSNFTELAVNYTFSGQEATGYTSQTGPSLVTPVVRSLQSVLDDRISVRDFGAVGDGNTDDTAAVLRSIQEIYVDNQYPGLTSLRRTVYFPAGTYTITQPLLIPPYVTLVGDGKDNTIVTSAGTVLQTTDSNYISGIGIGHSGATLPASIVISGLALKSTFGTNPVAIIDSASDVTFHNVQFTGIPTIPQLMLLSATAATPTDISLENCTFDTAQTGINATGQVLALNVTGTTFKNLGVGMICSPLFVGLSATNNYFSNVITPVQNLSGANYALANTSADVDVSGLQMGLAKYGIGKYFTLNAGGNALFTLSLGSGIVDYEISDAGHNYRYGVLKYSRTSAGVSFEDDYTETANTLPAVVSVNNTGMVSCEVTDNTILTIKFNQKQFV
jgi:Pectate lyase superfamily protein/Major tropism determinant N-terminal domain